MTTPVSRCKYKFLKCKKFTSFFATIVMLFLFRYQKYILVTLTHIQMSKQCSAVGSYIPLYHSDLNHALNSQFTSWNTFIRTDSFYLSGTKWVFNSLSEWDVGQQTCFAAHTIGSARIPILLFRERCIITEHKHYRYFQNIKRTNKDLKIGIKNTWNLFCGSLFISYSRFYTLVNS